MQAYHNDLNIPTHKGTSVPSDFYICYNFILNKYISCIQW